MSSLTGTLTLLRLAARRDRIQIPIWTVVIVASVVGELIALQTTYTTEAARASYAMTVAASAPTRLFGAIDGSSLGSMLVVEIYLTAAVIIGLMSSFMVVRHTRQNEQTGRLELIGSACTGRNSSLASALIIAAVVNCLIVVLTIPMLMSLDLPSEGAAMLSIAIGGVGLVFAGVAAVTSQLANSSRGANGMAALVLGASFLVRATGDVAGRVGEDGMSVIIAWPSWLSPLGWGQLAYPFSQHRWWVLLVYPAAFIALSMCAFVLSGRRDVGHGLLRTRPSPPEAAPLLSSSFGLAVRLQRNVWIAWLIGVVVTGVTFGSFVSEFDKMIEENERMRLMITMAGGSDVLVEAYYAVIMGFMGVILASYAAHSMLRLREEEECALETLLAHPVSRLRWLASHVVVGMSGAALLLIACGLSTGITARLVGEKSIGALDLLAASLIQIPPVICVAAFAVMAFGLFPRMMVALTWSAIGVVIVVMIGELFRIPEWMLNVSPFTHVAKVPSEDVDWSQVIGLLSVAAAMTIAGGVSFRRRDVAGN